MFNILIAAQKTPVGQMEKCNSKPRLQPPLPTCLHTELPGTVPTSLFFS